MKTIQISFRYNRFSAFVSFRRCPCVRVSVCVSVLLSLCQCFHLLLVGDALSQVNSCWFINRAFPLNFCHSFIHSGHFYSALSSPLLLRGAPDYSTDTTVSKFHAEAHRQLQLKDLPKVPTWRLYRAGVEPTIVRLTYTLYYHHHRLHRRRRRRLRHHHHHHHHHY